MARVSPSYRVFDFSGGLVTNSPATALQLNQASDLQNINLLSSGGFVKRRGNAEFNSSAMNSGADVQGLGYYRQGDGDDWLMAIAGAKIFKSDSLDGTMDDITGAVVITAAQNNLWTHSVMNDTSIFVGGAPDAPIAWPGTGNAAALAGTPPNGNFGIQFNNYFFIGNTTANPSRIQWSVLGDPTDWAGTGSGSQDVSTNDGDTLIGASALTNDRLILFKENSIHELIGRTSPFPVFLKVKGIGAAGKQAIVNVDDIIYFVTPEPRMKAFDGYKVYDFPDTIDDVWNGLNANRVAYIQGFYNKRLKQIWWICSNGSATTNNYCIVWDLQRKCWLRHTAGYGMNQIVLAQDRTIYGGAYDGKLYEMDKSSTFTDASETTTAISAYWRSGWHDLESMIQQKYAPYVDINFKAQTTGTYEYGYGFDFVSDSKISSRSMQAPGSQWDQFLWDVGRWGGQTDLTSLIFMKGRGKFIQFLLRNKNDNEQLQINGLEIPIKKGKEKALRVA